MINKNISITNSYDEIEDSIKQKINDKNIFISKSYEKYICAKRNKMYYIYSSNFIVSIIVKKYYIFKYSQFLIEPIFFYDMTQEEKKDILNEIVELIYKKTNSMWIDTPATALFTIYPKNAQVIPFGNCIIDLSQTEETLWTQIHSKHKNVIRNAERKNVVIKIGISEELLNDYLILDNQTSKREKRLIRQKIYFSKMIESLKENMIIAISYHEKKPQAGGIFYFSSEMSYYMYGATSDNPLTGAANYLLWKTLLFFKDKNIKNLNLVGYRINVDKNSKYEGIQRFKKRFGGEIKKIYLFRCIKNKGMYIFYKYLRNVYLKSGKDIIDSEIYKWEKIQLDNWMEKDEINN